MKKILVLITSLLLSTSLLLGCSGATAKYDLAKYNKVEIGMSHKQVAEIMGDKGIEEARSEMPEIPGVSPKVVFTSYTWQNPDGSNMGIQFENDKVTTKAQAGLN